MSMGETKDAETWHCEWCDKDYNSENSDLHTAWCDICGDEYIERVKYHAYTLWYCAACGEKCNYNSISEPECCS